MLACLHLLVVVVVAAAGDLNLKPSEKSSQHTFTLIPTYVVTCTQVGRLLGAIPLCNHRRTPYTYLWLAEWMDRDGGLVAKTCGCELVGRLVGRVCERWIVIGNACE